MPNAYKLYYYPSSASLAPHILLEEIGCPFELVLVDRKANAHKSPDYLKLNPAGLIPVLIDGNMVLSETTAIMLHIADHHPHSDLVPPIGSDARAQTYRWLIYLTNTVQAMLVHYFYPHRIGGANADTVKENASAAIMPMLDILDCQLAQSGGPYLLGAKYNIADIFLFMICRWTRNTPDPARNRPHLASFLKRMADRPAVKRVFATEQLPAPWY
jgi:glutathione S-transferase